MPPEPRAPERSPAAASTAALASRPAPGSAVTASAPSTQPGGGEGAGGGQRGHRRKFPEVVGLFRRPAPTRPDRRGGPAREKSELGCSGGRRPKTESGFSSVSLLAPRLPGAPPGIGLGLKKRRNGRGRQQRPSRVNTAPGRSRGGPNPIRIIKQYGRDPLRKQG